MIHKVQDLSLLLKSGSNMLFLGSMIYKNNIDKKYLREYRCPTCNKLLAKGTMSNHDDLLEVKCRGCSTICLFKGEHAEIVKERSRLIKDGYIPDTDS